MRIRETMERNADNAGWALFATVFGMLATPHGLTQFVTTMVTLCAGIVVAHFLKRFLHKHWPHRDGQNNGVE